MNLIRRLRDITSDSTCCTNAIWKCVGRFCWSIESTNGKNVSSTIQTQPLVTSTCVKKMDMRCTFVPFICQEENCCKNAKAAIWVDRSKWRAKEFPTFLQNGKNSCIDVLTLIKGKKNCYTKIKHIVSNRRPTPFTGCTFKILVSIHLALKICLNTPESICSTDVVRLPRHSELTLYGTREICFSQNKATKE